MGSKHGEWGNGEGPNRPNKGDMLVPPTEKKRLGTNIWKNNPIT